MGASLSNVECTIYVLILPHSPSDITLLYKSKVQKDHMNTFQSALKSMCIQSVLEWLMSHNLFNRNIQYSKLQLTIKGTL